MASEWRKAIPEEEWLIYERGGFGHRAGYGANPAVLVIDVQYQTVGDEALPILESINRGNPLSCGEVGWRAVKAIARLLEAARKRNLPIIYPYIAPNRA